MVEETLTEGQERFKAAVAAQDEEYLGDFQLGRDAAFQNAQIDFTDSEDEFTQPFIDGYESGKATRDQMEDTAVRNKVYVQPHALGGLEVIVFGSDGTQTSARIPLEGATSLAAVLNMWITTMLQQSFFETAQAARQATESGIVIPGR